MKKKRVCAKLVCILVVMGLLGGLSGGIGLAQKPYAGVEITVIGYPPELPMIDVSEFEKKTGIKILVEEYSWGGTHTKIMTDFAAGGDAYDVLFASDFWTGECMQGGIAYPLTSFIFDERLADPDYDLSEFVPEWIYHYCVYNGQLYALPYQAGTGLLFYRKDLWEDPEEKAAFQAKYGYELRPAETFSELRDMAEFFTRPGGEKVQYGITQSLKQEFAFPDYRMYAFPRGAWPVDRDGKPTINSEENVETLKFLVSLVPFMPPGALGFTSGESCATFTTGKSAMTLEYTAYLQTALTPEKSPMAAEGNVGLARPPAYNGVRASCPTGSNVVLYSGSQNKEAAFLFMQWLTAREQQKKGFLDRWLSIARLRLIKELEPEYPWLKALEETYRTATLRDPLCLLRQGQQAKDTIGEAIGSVILGERTAEEGLDWAQGRLERFLR